MQSPTDMHHPGPRTDRIDPDSLIVPFIVVPVGELPPTEWLAAHPDPIRIPGGFGSMFNKSPEDHRLEAFPDEQHVMTERLPTSRHLPIFAPDNHAGLLPSDVLAKTGSGSIGSLISAAPVRAASRGGRRGLQPTKITPDAFGPGDRTDPLQRYAESTRPSTSSSTRTLELHPHQIDPVPFLDDDGNPVLGPDGDPVLRPEGFDPHFFIQQGIKDRDELLLEILHLPFGVWSYVMAKYLNRDLGRFGQGHIWDAQRIDREKHPEFFDYSTIVIAIYAATFGFYEKTILFIEDIYAWLFSKFPGNTIFDREFPHLPERNRKNTDTGLTLYNSRKIR